MPRRFYGIPRTVAVQFILEDVNNAREAEIIASKHPDILIVVDVIDDRRMPVTPIWSLEKDLHQQK